jgi:hypothetical protein
MLSSHIANYEEFKGKMWTAIDQEIQLRESLIYSLVLADPDSDPFAEEGNV